MGTFQLPQCGNVTVDVGLALLAFPALLHQSNVENAPIHQTPSSPPRSDNDNNPFSTNKANAVKTKKTQSGTDPQRGH